ncbi:MAG TPA: hypothetical protein V6C81_13815 [Planktothrix sp.]
MNSFESPAQIASDRDRGEQLIVIGFFKQTARLFGGFFRASGLFSEQIAQTAPTSRAGSLQDEVMSVTQNRLNIPKNSLGDFGVGLPPRYAKVQTTNRKRAKSRIRRSADSQQAA